jgi:hypothetical protein
MISGDLRANIVKRRNNCRRPNEGHCLLNVASSAKRSKTAHAKTADKLSEVNACMCVDDLYM